MPTQLRCALCVVRLLCPFKLDRTWDRVRVYVCCVYAKLYIYKRQVCVNEEALGVEITVKQPADVSFTFSSMNSVKQWDRTLAI